MGARNLFVPSFWLIEGDANRLNSTFNLPGRRIGVLSRATPITGLDRDCLAPEAIRSDDTSPSLVNNAARWRGIWGGGVIRNDWC